MIPSIEREREQIDSARWFQEKLEKLELERFKDLRVFVGAANAASSDKR